MCSYEHRIQAVESLRLEDSDLLEAQTSYLVLRVLPLGNEFGENASNPRPAISPATISWSLLISSGDGDGG